MQSWTLQQWLGYLETQSSETIIDLGLDRVLQVKQVLGLAYACPVIMVAGTNGKGSTCSMLEAMLLQAGYRVGLYIKPHFLHFNERARIHGEMASDAQLIASFYAVEQARMVAAVGLTYFEFTTLAIMHLLAQSKLDVVILEVGLGGRLDAVNIVDADVAIVTSIDIDHIEFLGDTREAIGREKAGIFRAGKTAICSDPQPPQSLIDHAAKVGADLWLFGRDFNYSGDKQQWNYGGRSVRRHALAYPALRGANQLLNASAALAALEALRLVLPVGAQEARTGLAMVELPGRFQVLPGRPCVVLDVAHNPHAAAALAQNLGNMGFYRYTHAVFGVMADKDIAGVIAPLIGLVDHWHVATLPSPRAESSENLLQRLTQTLNLGPERSVTAYDSPQQAYCAASDRAKEDDRILVFGSFLTVAAVFAIRQAGR
jgi:dihydrofolate synthase / folylpolyglutamate synthase